MVRGHSSLCSCLCSVVVGALLVVGSTGCETPSPDSATRDRAVTTAAAAKDDKLTECPHAEDGAACGSETPAANQSHFGAPFSIEVSEPLSAVAANLKDGGKHVRVKGTVASVCQTAGCWMVIQDGDIEARIFTKGKGLFMPTDIAGRTAEVEGQLEAKTIAKDFAKHLEKDRGGDPDKITSDTREFVMRAKSVKLL